MRTRLIRPAFWADETVADLPAPCRLTFMGLWGLSDDDGYFDWRPTEIAAELYRYAPTKARVRQVEGHLARLVEAGPVQALECGRHGRIDSMPTHRIQSGRHTFPTRETHLSTCVAGRNIPRPSASRSESVRNGAETETDSVRIGSVSGAQPRADESPLDAVAAATGGAVARFAAQRKSP